MLKNKKLKLYGLGGIAFVLMAIAGCSIYAVSAMPRPSASRLVSSHLPRVQSTKTTAQTTKQSTGSKPSGGSTKTSPLPIGPTAQPASTVVTASVPASLQLYANPSSSLAYQANSWASTHPADAPAINRLVAQPMAEWYGGWNANVQAEANTYVTAATAAGKLPTLVAYNIPNRDCGSYSAGGVADATTYQTWIQQFAQGIGHRKAIVILEPDALAADCYSAIRAGMLAGAVQTLASTTGASVYLDAGNPTWQSAATMAARLQASGIAQATGFSLNISNFQTTNANIAYGTQISRATGGKHFVIDTSRNGSGPTADNQWCNPAGRTLGYTPTLATGQPLADAYLWLHGPGGSDGQCGPDQAGTSAPSAGTWWPQYAIEMLKNSGWY